MMAGRMMHLLLLLWCTVTLQNTSAFAPVVSFFEGQAGRCLTQLRNPTSNSKDTLLLAATTSPLQSPPSSADTDKITNIKQSLQSLIASTDRGRSTTIQQRQALEELFHQLECLSPLSQPARSPLVEGKWEVQYTTAPPPSNGQLGPFAGIAQQVVNLSIGGYQNLLVVPPNDWLTATLDATWEEWDGVLLQETNEEQSKRWVSKATTSIAEEPSKSHDDDDHGATCWKVTFESLTIQLLKVPILTKKFEDTQRIWRTTYVDESTRLVRAGRTGQREDEMVFYMTRMTE